MAERTSLTSALCYRDPRAALEFLEAAFGFELVMLIDGRMSMILDEPCGERRVEMTPGSTCIVPRGVWHRALVPQPSRFLALTYGPGTTHRPI